MPKINGEFSFQNFINVPTTVVPANAFSPAAPEDELIGLSFGTPINASYSLQASQLIFSFSYIYALKAARNYRELALLTRLQKNEQLFEEIKLSLGQVILLKKQKKLLAENLEELEILKKKTNSLISSGLLESSSINDLLAMELDFQGGLELLINNEELAKLSLKSMIGYPLDSSIVLIEGFSFSSKDDFLEKKVLNPNDNSSIKLGQQNVILNELNLKATKSEGYPSLFGFFNQQHMAMRNSFNLFDSSKEWYPATLWGINVTIPIYNSGEGKSKNKQKELELTKAKNGLLEIENRIFSLYKMLKTNYHSVANLVDYCNAREIKLIHYSTDYVFDGSRQPNYPDSPKNPLQNYGISKLISEYRVQKNCTSYAIIRTPVLYSENSKIHEVKKQNPFPNSNLASNYKQQNPIYFRTHILKMMFIRDGNVSILKNHIYKDFREIYYDS